MRTPLRSALLLAALAPGVANATPARGVDVSSLAAVESHGGRFRDASGEADALTLLHHAGCDAVRLRVWHTPSDPDASLEAMLALARRAHALDMRVLVDLHYSDTWADPAHQTPPAAWQRLAFAALADSTEHWTRDVIAAFVSQGTAPEAVQVGNEVDRGMLWEHGRLTADATSMDRFAVLVARGAAGVRAACPQARVMVHVTAGRDAATTCAFLDGLARRHVRVDALGVSYYPRWHGSLAHLRTWLAAIARHVRMPITVVETAYPWTLAWFDDTHNVFGDARALLTGTPASAAGQVAYLETLQHTLTVLPESQRGGLYWWEPAWIAVPGAGSPWENATLFDAEGVLQPAARTLGGDQPSR